jgi:hypothetical protein
VITASDPEPGRREPAAIDLRSIHVQDLRLRILPASDPEFQLRDVQGFVRVSQKGPPGVQVRLDGISAQVEEPEVLGYDLEVLRVDGFVHGGAEQVVGLDIGARLGDERIDAEFALYPREETSVVVKLDPSGSETLVAALAAQLASWFAEGIEVQMD